MNFLKKLPIQYEGELHDIKLVNFTVDIDEVKELVPPQIRIRDFEGKAMISMVDVKLRKMHPSFLPSFVNFEYRHVAFRLLVDDSEYNDGECKGIYFLKSFTDKSHIVLGSKVLTDYNLELARINDRLDSVVITQGDQKVVYQRDDKPSIQNNEKLHKIIAAIDRAYSVVDGELRVTQILRKKWPIKCVECAFFENTFFGRAELQGVFRVEEVIYYNWLPSKRVEKPNLYQEYAKNLKSLIER